MRKSQALAILRVALIVGACIDGFVAILALLFQPFIGALLDVPVRDPALTTIVGGEFAVVVLVYVALVRDLSRFAPLLWLVALDQLLAVILPGIEVVRGNIPATWKTLAPMPGSLALAAIYAWGAANFAKRKVMR